MIRAMELMQERLMILLCRSIFQLNRLSCLRSIAQK